MTTTSNTSFVERDVHAGKGYTYTIRCVDKSESSFISDFNSSGWYVRYYDMPVVSKVNSKENKDGTCTYSFSWSNTAPKYNIEMRYAGEKTWRTVATNYTGTSYAHTPTSPELGDETRLRTYRVYATDGSYKLSPEGVSPYHMTKRYSDTLQYRPMITDAAGWYYALMWSMDLYDTDFSECPGYNGDDTSVMTQAYDEGFYTAGMRERLISLRNAAPTRQFIANSIKLAYQYPTKPISSKHNASVNTSMLTVVPGTPLYRAMEKGLYEESTETEKLEEIHELVRCLTNDTIFMNEHASNLFHVQCRILESKEELLSYIRKFMEENDEKKLRQYREYITRAF